MLLLAGLHLLHLHVPVITTHLRTGLGGAIMGRAALSAALEADLYNSRSASAGPH